MESNEGSPLTDEERERVKLALVRLIEECAYGGRMGECAADRLDAASRGVGALLMLAILP